MKSQTPTTFSMWITSPNQIKQQFSYQWLTFNSSQWIIPWNAIDSKEFYLSSILRILKYFGIIKIFAFEWLLKFPPLKYAMFYNLYPAVISEPLAGHENLAILLVVVIGIGEMWNF